MTVLSVFFVQDMPKTLKKRVDKTLVSHFELEEVVLIPVDVQEELIKELPESFDSKRLFSLSHKEQMLGFAYIGKAPSLSEYFDFMVILNLDLEVVNSKVLIYREDYGGEIGSKRWLQQFEGAAKGDELVLNKDIVAISGATISVNALTRAINDMLLALEVLSKNKVFEL